MRDLPTILILGTLALVLPTQAEADELDDVRCDSSPLASALCDEIAARQVAEVERDGCINESAALELERDRLRARQQVLEQRAAVDAVRRRRSTAVALVVGVAAGAGVAYGSVWLAGRL